MFLCKCAHAFQRGEEGYFEEGKVFSHTQEILQDRLCEIAIILYFQCSSFANLNISLKLIKVQNIPIFGAGIARW